MNASLRLTFTCSLFALPLLACGDDGGGGTDTNSTQTNTDATTSTGTDTTEPPTTGTTSTTDTTNDTPATDPSTTTGPDDTTTTSTTEPATSTTEPDTSTTDDTTTTTTANGLSWETDVYPVVVEGNCSCHGNGSGGLTMTNAQDSHANLVDVDSSEAPGFKRVATGDPDSSYIVAKLKGVHQDPPFNGSGQRMPLGAPPLPDPAIATLEQWISEGALP